MPRACDRDQVLVALGRWHRQHGCVPTQHEWDDSAGGSRPWSRTIQRRWGWHATWPGCRSVSRGWPRAAWRPWPPSPSTCPAPWPWLWQHGVRRLRKRDGRPDAGLHRGGGGRCVPRGAAPAGAGGSDQRCRGSRRRGLARNHGGMKPGQRGRSRAHQARTLERWPWDSRRLARLTRMNGR